MSFRPQPARAQPRLLVGQFVAQPVAHPDQVLVFLLSNTGISVSRLQVGQTGASAAFSEKQNGQRTVGIVMLYRSTFSTKFVEAVRPSESLMSMRTM